MPDPHDEIKRTFREAFSDGFLEDVMRLTAAEYRTAAEECRMFYPPQEAHDLRPHVRRAKIESKLREVARSHVGVSASVESNCNGSSYHTRLLSNKVVLTVSHVNQPSDMVRRAEFRNIYARCAQIGLFDTGTEKPVPPDTLLYGILRHGASSKNPQRPDFIRIGFPDQDCRYYVCDIDLFAIPRFRDLANELWPAQLETVKDDLDMKLRSDAKNKNKKQGDE